MKKHQILIGLFIFGVALISSKFYFENKNRQQDQTSNYSHLGGDFNLQGKDKTFTLKDLKGRPSILYFGFASCPDVCPLSLSKLNKAIDKINPDFHNLINKVFISVDHKRDNPKKVQEYAEYFGDSFIGLTGSKEQIDQMTKSYAVYYKFVPLVDSKMEYTVDHTSRFYVLDKEGKILNTFSDVVNDKEFSMLLNRILSP